MGELIDGTGAGATGAGAAGAGAAGAGAAGAGAEMDFSVVSGTVKETAPAALGSFFSCDMEAHCLAKSSMEGPVLDAGAGDGATGGVTTGTDAGGLDAVAWGLTTSSLLRAAHSAAKSAIVGPLGLGGAAGGGEVTTGAGDVTGVDGAGPLPPLSSRFRWAHSAARLL